MIKSAVCALIQHGPDKYLSITRRNNSKVWGIPGGKVDPGESNFDALKRELHEETGFIGKQDHYEPIYSGICKGKDGNDFWVTTYFIDFKDGLSSCLVPEKGLILDWKTHWELCDPDISPFWKYNKNVFFALEDYLGYI